MNSVENPLENDKMVKTQDKDELDSASGQI